MTGHRAETEIYSMTAAEEGEAEEETVETAETVMHMELHHVSKSAKRVRLHHQRSASQRQT